jgi:hypothetical protein
MCEDGKNFKLKKLAAKVNDMKIFRSWRLHLQSVDVRSLLLSL